MTYMGSKSRLAKNIVPIIQKQIDNTKANYYIEPFVGGANIIDKIKCEHRIGYDISPILIALLQQGQTDFSKIPLDIDKERFNELRLVWKNQSNLDKYNLYELGAASFFASYSARGFAGGYANSVNGRNYYKERYNNFKKQVEAGGLNGVEFINDTYTNIPKDLEKAVIYCDPPYLGVTGYEYKTVLKEAFNHDKFWNWVREMSAKNIVLVSEKTVPDDCTILWEKDLNHTTGRYEPNTVKEKLVTFNKLS